MNSFRRTFSCIIHGPTLIKRNENETRIAASSAELEQAEYRVHQFMPSQGTAHSCRPCKIMPPTSVPGLQKLGLQRQSRETVRRIRKYHVSPTVTTVLVQYQELMQTSLTLAFAPHAKIWRRHGAISNYCSYPLYGSKRGE